MTASILPFVRRNKELLDAQEIMYQTARDLWPHVSVHDFGVAIGIGWHAMERGTPLLEALELVENSIELMRVTDPVRDREIRCRNRERLAMYKLKLEQWRTENE